MDSTLTMADVAQYFTAFQAKYGFPCTLTVDAVEQVLAGTEDDDEEIIVAAMHDAQQADGNETGPDRSEPGNIPVEIESGSAWDYAKKMDDAEFRRDLETNAQAALENKRGAAVIRRDLVRLYGLKTIETVWPLPGSSPKTHPGNGPWAKYPKIVKDADGQDKPGEGDWYVDLFDGSPDGQELAKRITSVKAAKAGETGTHILPEHKAMAGDEIKLTAEKSALDGFRTNKKNAIIRAVNIVKRMARLNEETKATVELITDDGKPEGVPVKSNKLVYMFNSEDRKQFRVLTIGQMLALDVDKAKANGGTYSATIGTTGRKPRASAVAVSVKVENVKAFDDVTAAYATYADTIGQQVKAGDMKAYNALLTHLNAPGSDDLLLSMNTAMNFLEGLLSKPGIAKRLTDALVEGGKKAAA